MMLAEMKLVLILAVCVDLVEGQEDGVWLPPSIHASSVPTHIYYRDFGSVDLPCSSDGRPKPQYHWSKNGAELDLDQWKIAYYSDASSGSITIKDMSASDQGYYQCMAENIYGKSLSPVYFLQRAVLHMNYSSDITQYTVEEGDSLKVPCYTVISVPPPTYGWEVAREIDDKNPSYIHTSRRVNLDKEGNLYFSYTTPDDSYIENGIHMIYKCNARNNVNDQAMGGGYSQITVNENDNSADKKPQIQYATSSPHIAIYGDTLEILCIYSGRPEVAITWSPAPSGRIRTERFGTALLIEKTDFSDQGTYTCTGRNTAGAESYSVEVIIQARPTFHVDKKPRNTNASEGSTVAFECGAEQRTKPAASIQWLINGEPVNNDFPGTRTEVSDAGEKLTVYKVCQNCPEGGTDLKVIQCNVSNIHGYVFADAYLNVLSWDQVEEVSPFPTLTLLIVGCVILAVLTSALTAVWLHRRKAKRNRQQTNMQFPAPIATGSEDDRLVASSRPPAPLPRPSDQVYAEIPVEFGYDEVRIPLRLKPSVAGPLTDNANTTDGYLTPI